MLLSNTLARWKMRPRGFDLILLAGMFTTAAMAGTFLAWSRQKPDFLDEFDFLELAENLVNLSAYTANGTTPTAWKPPLEAAFLYPFVSAFGIDGAVLPARLVGLAVYLLGAYLFVATCRRAGRPGVALVVAAGMCLSPAGLMVATSLYPQVLVGAAVAAGTWITFGPGALPPRFWPLAYSAVLRCSDTSRQPFPWPSCWFS